MWPKTLHCIMITFIFQESVPVPEIKENGDMINSLVNVLYTCTDICYWKYTM